MDIKLLVGLLVVLAGLDRTGGSLYKDEELLYDKFPDGFIWASATSAYQIEGAWDVDGLYFAIFLESRMKGTTGNLARNRQRAEHLGRVHCPGGDRRRGGHRSASVQQLLLLSARRRCARQDERIAAYFNRFNIFQLFSH